MTMTMMMMGTSTSVRVDASLRHQIVVCRVQKQVVLLKLSGHEGVQRSKLLGITAIQRSQMTGRLRYSTDVKACHILHRLAMASVLLTRLLEHITIDALICSICSICSAPLDCCLEMQ